MASTYSTRLRFVLQATGENAGTWGSTLNTGALQLIDDAIAAYTTIDVSAGTTTLSTQDGATDQTRSAFLMFKGSPGAQVSVVVPSITKGYWVQNQANASVRVMHAGGTGFTVPASAWAMVISDGTSIYSPTSNLPTVQIGNWTPALANAPATTYAKQEGSFYRVGRLVYVNFNVIITSVDPTFTGDVFLVSLPFGTQPHTSTDAGVGFPLALDRIAKCSLNSGYTQFAAHAQQVNTSASYSILFTQLGSGVSAVAVSAGNIATGGVRLNGGGMYIME